MAEQTPQHANARYILALMLERKRVLKEVETRHTEGQLLRIYEHSKSGEVFLIPDPQLRLDQVASVQLEIAELLGAPGPNPTTPPPTPTPSYTPSPDAEPPTDPTPPASSQSPE